MARARASESAYVGSKSSHDARSTRGREARRACARRTVMTPSDAVGEEARSLAAEAAYEMPPRSAESPSRGSAAGAVRPVSSSRSRRRSSGDAACTQLQKSAGVRSVASSDAQPSNAIEASSSCALSSRPAAAASMRVSTDERARVCRSEGGSAEAKPSARAAVWRSRTPRRRQHIARRRPSILERSAGEGIERPEGGAACAEVEEEEKQEAGAAEEPTPLPTPPPPARSPTIMSSSSSVPSDSTGGKTSGGVGISGSSWSTHSNSLPTTEERTSAAQHAKRGRHALRSEMPSDASRPRSDL